MSLIHEYTNSPLTFKSKFNNYLKPLKQQTFKWQHQILPIRLNQFYTEALESPLTIRIFPTSLRLCTRGNYLITFILKWLTQKPYLGNHNWFAIALYDARSRPKGVKTLKRPWSFKVRSCTESFYNSSESYHKGFLL